MAAGEAYQNLIAPMFEAIKFHRSEKEFLASFSSVPREIGILYAAAMCQFEVCNGGFDQFFFNSTGILAPEAEQGFRAIGQIEVAGLVLEAMAKFAPVYIRDWDARRVALDRLPDECLQEIDERFYALIETEAGGFRSAADRYALEVSQSRSRPTIKD